MSKAILARRYVRNGLWTALLTAIPAFILLAVGGFSHLGPVECPMQAAKARNSVQGVKEHSFPIAGQYASDHVGDDGSSASPPVVAGHPQELSGLRSRFAPRTPDCSPLPEPISLSATAAPTVGADTASELEECRPPQPPAFHAAPPVDNGPPVRATDLSLLSVLRI